MELVDAISQIESVERLDDLRAVMHRIAQDCGFASFTFLDVGHAGNPEPYYIGTAGEDWEREYAANDFALVDPCLDMARRSNMPFRWDEISLPRPNKGKKPGALKTFEAAYDHGFKNGLVIPYHFVDSDQRRYSSLVVFYWKDAFQKMSFLLRGAKVDLQVVVIYWVNKFLELRADEKNVVLLLKPTSDQVISPLSDREREVLAWAARGKTGPETADIMAMKVRTVDFHLRNAIVKVNATNKTQAVAIALKARQISL